MLQSSFILKYIFFFSGIVYFISCSPRLSGENEISDDCIKNEMYSQRPIITSDFVRNIALIKFDSLSGMVHFRLSNNEDDLLYLYTSFFLDSSQSLGSTYVVDTLNKKFIFDFAPKKCPNRTLNHVSDFHLYRYSLIDNGFTGLFRVNILDVSSSSMYYRIAQNNCATYQKKALSIYKDFNCFIRIGYYKNIYPCLPHWKDAVYSWTEEEARRHDQLVESYLPLYLDLDVSLNTFLK